jgi:hypothetical protein
MAPYSELAALDAETTSKLVYAISLAAACASMRYRLGVLDDLEQPAFAHRTGHPLYAAVFCS